MAASGADGLLSHEEEVEQPQAERDVLRQEERDPDNAQRDPDPERSQSVPRVLSEERVKRDQVDVDARPGRVVVV